MKNRIIRTNLIFFFIYKASLNFKQKFVKKYFFFQKSIVKYNCTVRKGEKKMNKTIDKEKALAQVLADIEKQFGKGAIMKLGEREKREIVWGRTLDTLAGRR